MNTKDSKQLELNQGGFECYRKWEAHGDVK